MWVRDDGQALREMARVTKCGGAIIALAEPDYSKRISQPELLTQLGEMQTGALRSQGADVEMGGRLRSIFAESGLNVADEGFIRRESDQQKRQKAFLDDLPILEKDLTRSIGHAETKRLVERARQLTKREAVSWYVPIHYAMGRAG